MKRRVRALAVAAQGPGAVCLSAPRRSLLHRTVEWQGRIYEGKHEHLVSRRIWDRVQAALDRRGGKRYGKGKIPYNGLARCGLCGASMTCEGVSKKLASGETRLYGYLRCSMSGARKRGRPLPRLKVPKLEGLLGQHVDRIRFQDDALEVIREALLHSHEEHVDRVEKALSGTRPGTR